MLILSNCLTDKPDEGCLNVAGNIVKRIKKKYPDTEVVSFERNCTYSDKTLQLNKFFLNKSLFSVIRKCNDNILYIPFPARGVATALRIFMVSLFAKKKINVLLTMKTDMDFIARFLLKISGADLTVLTEKSEDFYKKYVSADRIFRLKAGVDTKKFTPVSKEHKSLLKEKFDLPQNKSIILHTGHLKKGRNIEQLLKIDEKYQVVLVVSTLTKNEQDADIKAELLNRPNIRIIEEYVANIEEIYQLCDIYFFPTEEEGSCIDIPLSCMEASACNKPLITTNFGGMEEFKCIAGYNFIEDMSSYNLNDTIEEVLKQQSFDTRSAVLDYDWDNAIDLIVNKR